MKPYEIFEHTADIGLKIHGRNLEELFRHAALGLFDLITDTAQIKASPNARPETVDLRLEAADEGELLLKWLRELLFLFSARKFVPYDFAFSEINSAALKARVSTAVFDPSAHEQKYEVKAVTYHEFKIRHDASGWHAQVILDI